MTMLLPAGVRIFIASQPADLRKSFDGLAALTREIIKQDPLAGHLFVFRNKKGRRVKVLFWDRTGWVLWYKRLESGVFRFPIKDSGAVEIEAFQLRLLLDGVPLGPRVPRRAAEA
ncbi:MAG: IS66 family insertion sequence element accessory protein TnpB [Planctomycetes bacterium]|nr:IS66 family insertion sequence element accessory protein TnpB [Planctomycetota bacterium]